MGYGKRSSGSKPTHYISVTARAERGDGYEKGPTIGLWEGDGGRSPIFRGSAKGKYLDELYDFIKHFGQEEVSFAIFKSKDFEDSPRRESRDDSNRSDDRRPSREAPRREERGEPQRRAPREEDPAPRRSSREAPAGAERAERKAAPKKDWFSDT